MRSVGYRQFWEYLDGTVDRDTAAERALFATRQLAKRQITWLRGEPALNVFDPLETDASRQISALIQAEIPL